MLFSNVSSDSQNELHNRKLISINKNTPIIIKNDVKVQNANEKKVSLKYLYSLLYTLFGRPLEFLYPLKMNEFNIFRI